MNELIARAHELLGELRRLGYDPNELVYWESTVDEMDPEQLEELVATLESEYQLLTRDEQA